MVYSVLMIYCVFDCLITSTLKFCLEHNGETAISNFDRDKTLKNMTTFDLLCNELNSD